MWGVTIMIIVRDMPFILSCQADLAIFVRGVFGLCAVTVNLWLQMTILFYVNKYIVGQSVHDTQDNYSRFHAEVFNKDGSFDHSAWHKWTGPYMELCNLAVSKFGFTMAIVFIWSTRMLGEFRSIERLHKDINCLQTLPAGKGFEEMLWEKPKQDINDDDEEQQYEVVSLTTRARFFIYLTIIIPKLCIAGFLMFIGCRWLCATESFSDLILNALALEFVIGVDELVYQNFAPQRMQDLITNTKIAQITDIKKGAKDSVSDVVWPYIKSIFYMMLVFAWSYFYLGKLQQVIPGFTHDIQAHCGGWFTEHYKPSCAFGTQHPAKCFPYGGGD